jgi:hypothetical protein
MLMIEGCLGPFVAHAVGRPTSHTRLCLHSKLSLGIWVHDLGLLDPEAENYAVSTTYSIE